MGEVDSFVFKKLLWMLKSKSRLELLVSRKSWCISID